MEHPQPQLAPQHPRENRSTGQAPSRAATAAHESRPDDELMELVQSGDQHAFGEIVRRHQGPLLGFFYVNSRDRHLAEDLTQETLLRVYNQAWDYLATGKFQAWLYRVARNLLIDTVRRQSHDAVLLALKSDHDDDTALSGLADSVISAVDRADQHEVAQIVEAFLETLPAEQRETFAMHHFTGLSLPEVAEILETNVATTKSRLRLAREKLQEHLKSRGIVVDSPNQNIPTVPTDEV